MLKQHRFTIFAFVLLLSTRFSLSAQIQHGKEDNNFRVFDAGLVLGFNLAQVDGDNLAGFNKIGLNTGGIAHINFNPEWSLSFEILLAQKGSRTRADPNIITTYKLTMNYVEVPIQINYNDKNRLIFSAGACYGRLFSFKEFINGYENLNNEDAFFSDELSYVVGGTFLIGPKRHFGANFRYQGSITSIGKSSNPQVVGLTNRTISFRGIYYF